VTGLLPKSGAGWRVWVWAAGAVAALGLYFCRAVELPRWTAVGSERRLFPLHGLTVSLRESPDGARWLVMPEEPFVPPPATGAPVPRSLGSWGQGPRELIPFQASGSWWLDGTGLRRAWRLPAQGWADEDTLAARLVMGEVRVLNLENGRVRAAAPSLAYELLSGDEPDQDYWSYLEPPALSDPLAEAPVRGFTYVSPPLRKIADRTVSLGMSGLDLYAATQDLAPRFLLLARNARFVQLSRDGRTLFFERRGSLWRADLRRSVPELLDELRSPELPGPAE
jgi:hypothetical protein